MSTTANICNYTPLGTISGREIDRRFQVIHRNLCYVNGLVGGSSSFPQISIAPTGTTSYNVPFTLYTQTSTATVANTSVETTLISSGVGSVTLPAGILIPGRTLHIKLTGFHSSISSPTITLNFKIGGTTVLTSGAFGTANSTNSFVELDIIFTCYTSGTNGTAWIQGEWRESPFSGTAIFGLVNTSATTVNSTIDNVLDITLKWSAASSSNTITITNMTIIAYN